LKLFFNAAACYFWTRVFQKEQKHEAFLNENDPTFWMFLRELVLLPLT